MNGLCCCTLRPRNIVIRKGLLPRQDHEGDVGTLGNEETRVDLLWNLKGAQAFLHLR